MKQKIFWAAMALLTLSGITMVVYFGIRPRPVQKIKLSELITADRAAESLLMRLRQELINQKVLFIGIDPRIPVHQQIVDSLKRQNVDPQVAYHESWLDSRLQTTGLPDQAGSHFSFQDEPERLNLLLQSREQRILLVSDLATAHMASRLFPEVVSLLFVQVPRQRTDEALLGIPCQTVGDLEPSLSRLGCLVLQKARSLYLKKLTPGQLVGYLDQYSVNEFIFALAIEPTR